MKSDSVTYLANIVLVACVDGKVSATESAHLEQIRVEQGFKKSDLSAAMRAVEQATHRLTLTGTLGDQAKNLEGVLRVAYADADLSGPEARLLEEFCRMVGLYQDQFEKLSAQVLASLKREVACIACGATLDAEARFCPKCGQRVAEQEQGAVELQIPGQGVAIEFAESTGASFPKALELARKSPGFQSCQRAKKTWYLAVYPEGTLVDAAPLAGALGGLRNRRLYIDGKEQAWDEVFGFVWCATQRAAAYRPLEYCFGAGDNRLNPWGCRLARLDWVDWGDWFSYGQWEKAGLLRSTLQWRFDKERIRHELATNLFSVRFCPHLRADLPEAVLRHLPDTVIPQSDPNWQYNREYQETPGSVKVVAKQRNGDYEYEEEFWADGVRPRGLRVLGDLLSKALADLGVKEISVQQLLK